MSLRRVVLVLTLPSVLSACSGQGPPRPTDVAPFPMPNTPGIGLPNEQSYTSNEAADLVLDELTRLSWQRSVDTGPGDAGGFAWEEAIEHCESLVQGGHADFRLPTRLELVSIVDASQVDPSIDPAAFPGAPSRATWSASPYLADPERAYAVDFSVGATSASPLASDGAVRCVRSAHRPRLPTDDRFESNPGTVFDRMTGLSWEREILIDPKSFADAATYCENLAVDGSGGFRVPTMKELQTLVHETATPVAIDAHAFPDPVAGSYWSSTLVAGDSLSAWFVSFVDGTSDRAELQTPSFVRCVR